MLSITDFYNQLSQVFYCKDAHFRRVSALISTDWLECIVTCRQSVCTKLQQQLPQSLLYCKVKTLQQELNRSYFKPLWRSVWVRQRLLEDSLRLKVDQHASLSISVQLLATGCWVQIIQCSYWANIIFFLVTRRLLSYFYSGVSNLLKNIITTH